MSVPIGLSYHAGGIKVEDNASSVGLGWSLRAGGTVSRTVRGLPDEGSHGYLSGSVPLDPTTSNFFYDVLEGTADPQPDAFFFSFQGYSGKFVFDENGIPHIHPYQDLEISYTMGGVEFGTFTITTLDGAQYVFGENANYESTTTGTTSWSVPPGSTLGNPNHEIEQDSSTNTSRTSWYLTSIISPSQTETFTLNYASDNYEFRGPKKGNFGYRANGDVEFRKLSRTTIKILGRILTEISCNSNGLSVSFEANKERNDVRIASGTSNKAKAYTKIIVKDILGNSNRVFVLHTDYFRHPLLDVSNSGIASEEEFLFQRLKLTSVQEFSGNEIQSKPAYEFVYDEGIALPPKDAHTQDHWGYFNGSATTETNLDNYYSDYFMVPPYEGGLENGPLFYYYYNYNDPSNLQTYDIEAPLFISKQGTNREPSFPGMKAGILESIIYPTGGTTDFTYEQHQYGYVANVDFADTIYQVEAPLAEVDRPWDEPDALDEEVVEYGQFTVGPSQIVEVAYEVMFSYENSTEFANGYSYTDNEVELIKIGDPNPIVKVYYDVDVNSGIIVEEKPGQLTILTPIDNDDDDSDFPNGITATVSGSFNIQLESGESYLLRAKRAKSFVNGINVRNNTRAWIQIVQNVENDQVSQIIHEFDAGGLRVSQKTVNPDGYGTPMVENYTYHMFDNNGNDLGNSSGCMVALPEHNRSTYYYQEESSPVIVSTVPSGSFWNQVWGWIQKIIGVYNISNGQFQINGNSYLVFEMASDHPVALGTTQGNPLGYRKVKVSQPGNGFTIYTHSSAFEHPDELPGRLKWLSWLQNGNIPSPPTDWGEYDIAQDIPRFYYPFLPTKDFDWKRGLLLNQHTYNESNEQLSRVVNSYEFLEMSTVLGYSTIYSGIQIKYFGLNQAFYPWVEYIDNDFVVGFTNLNISIETIFEPGETAGISISRSNSYLGNYHKQMTHSRVVNSDGRIVENRMKYAPDYIQSLNIGANSNLTIQDLLDENMIAIPIETQTWEGTDADLKLVQATVTTFKDFNDSGSGEKNIRPFETYVFESNVPFDLIENKYTSRFQDIFPEPNLYIKRSELDYLAQGPPIQFNIIPGIPLTYIWTHNQSMIAAQVSNALANEVAYCSFEAPNVTADGNWTIINGGGIWQLGGKTGLRAFELPTSSSKVEKTVTQAGDYTVSLWYTGSPKVTAGSVSQTLPNASNWTYWEGTFSLSKGNTVKVERGSGVPLIDELRLFPSDAQMSTVCYDEKLRVQCMTDANGRSSYYSYDGLGRLQYVQDQDGNYVQQFTYHLKDN